jgi:hypothetical protein
MIPPQHHLHDPLDATIWAASRRPLPADRGRDQARAVDADHECRHQRRRWRYRARPTGAGTEAASRPMRPRARSASNG